MSSESSIFGRSQRLCCRRPRRKSQVLARARDFLPASAGLAGPPSQRSSPPTGHEFRVAGWDWQGKIGGDYAGRNRINHETRERRETQQRNEIPFCVRGGVHFAQVPHAHAVRNSPRRHGSTEMRIQRSKGRRSGLRCARKTGVARIWRRAVASMILAVCLSLLTPCAEFAQRLLGRRQERGRVRASLCFRASVVSLLFP